MAHESTKFNNRGKQDPNLTKSKPISIAEQVLIPNILLASHIQKKGSIPLILLTACYQYYVVLVSAKALAILIYKAEYNDIYLCVSGSVVLLHISIHS